MSRVFFSDIIMAENAREDGIYNLIGLVLTLIFILGIFLNGVVIVIFHFLHEETKRCADLLILSVSYCNLLHVSTYPLNIVSSFQHHWGYGTALCQMDGFWIHSLSIVSVAHLTALSFERYLTVTGRMTDRGRKLKLSLVLVCWLYGFFWGAMPLFGWSDYRLEGLLITCSITFSSSDPGDISFAIVAFLVDFLLPLALIIGFYIAILFTVRRCNRSTEVENASPSMTVINGALVSDLEHKAISMVFTMVAAFILGWMPYAIVCFLTMTSENALPPIFATLSAVVAKSSVWFFPIIYGFKHRTVKTGLGYLVNALRSTNQVSVINSSMRASQAM
uniref:C-like opsin n=1 Tax=Tripedalia cystophora TaxID=6141 RepID=A0A059NTD5_TRICY|nr:c-like opsin [Tripedalia cystophora]